MFLKVELTSSNDLDLERVCIRTFGQFFRIDRFGNSGYFIASSMKEVERHMSSAIIKKKNNYYLVGGILKQSKISYRAPKFYVDLGELLRLEEQPFISVIF